MSEAAHELEGKSGTLVYECPHCKTQVSVDAGLVSEAVNCPNSDCGKPFLVQPPPGQVVSESRIDNVSSKKNHVEGAADVETDVVTSHPSMFGTAPLKFLILCLLLVVGVLLLLTGFGGVSLGFNVAGPTVGIAGIILTAAVALIFGYWHLHNKFKVLIVSTERTIYRRGIVRKQTSEVQHDDVRNIQMDQSIFQRMIDVGDIAISSAGQSDMEISVVGFKHPNKVVELIRRYQ